MQLALKKYISLILMFSSVGAEAGFFDQQKRGWFWFEEKKVEEERVVTPESAKKVVEQFKDELDDLRSLMLASPTLENIKNYREKEIVMWDQAEKLFDNWELASFKYPHLFDKINEPVNVQAVRLQRSILDEENKKNIVLFVRDFDFVLFTKKDCRYCESFEPVLRSFANSYSIQVEAVSMDGSTSKYFPTKDIPYLVSRLNIQAFPTLIAAHKSKPMVFELVRGYLTYDELEKYVLLAKKYVEENHEEH